MTKNKESKKVLNNTEQENSSFKTKNDFPRSASDLFHYYPAPFLAKICYCLKSNLSQKAYKLNNYILLGDGLSRTQFGK